MSRYDGARPAPRFQPGGALHLAGKLRADDWKDREDAQFLIDDGVVIAG